MNNNIMNAAPAPKTPQEAMELLVAKNAEFVKENANTGNASAARRQYTTDNGQSPYAVIITCSDSRVPPEHVFNAGIGELFVIRTVGNIVGEYELGSIEYGADHLGAKIVVVLGHTYCGAVEAALSGGAHGHVKSIIDQIAAGLPENCDARQAEIINVQNCIKIVMTSELISELVNAGKLKVVGAVYDITDGTVKFMD